METKELLKKVKKIEIKSRGLSSQIFSGEYHSAFKGSGMAFSEVREYMPGDPVRIIDWNVTARLNKPYVKVFEEERELTVMLLVDMSASKDFGTRNQLKQEVVTELCAVLAFAAIQNNDKIGVIFFSDKIEKFIPPKKGKSHILRIIRELIDFKPESSGTNIKLALEYFTNSIKKHCTAFLLSDFIDKDFESALRLANKKHDLVALRIFDKTEKELPDIGLVPFLDAESDVVKWIDTSDKKTRSYYKAQALKREDKLRTIFQKAGIDYTDIVTNESYIKPLKSLFTKRERRR
ncbi:MAG: DUF58 domain-containing protein [Flavobacteriales bacterium]|nr:DUF58 domain-containing protein [Flavobacteriales bacterium]